MKFRITIGDWDAQQLHARTVRDDVFINEQNIPVELEWDERLLPDGHIGRMAVTRVLRGAGIGGAILEALMQQARKRGDKAVLLNAQIRAEPFYARYGFTREGEEFMEAGIPHIRMRHVFR